MRIIGVAVVTAVLIMECYAARVKRILNDNMTLSYIVVPKNVDTLTDIFTQGLIYGRFRYNGFDWDWKKEYPDKTKDNWAVGVGGSFIYKSAYYKGVGATVGIYTSQNPRHMKPEDVKFVKAGKDTFSRYKVKHTGHFGLTTVAQAYFEYNGGKIRLKAGRQIFETLLTKSNDTKMVPNSFEGYSITTSIFKKTRLEAGYFTRQKLRDHENFHDVITYKDAYGDSWGNNDDGAVNRALSYENFLSAGKSVQHSLAVVQIKSGYIPGLSFLCNYTTVPEVVALATLEAHYFIKNENYDLIPGVRYIKQYDRGAKDIGKLGVAVANLKARPEGYKDPYRVDGALRAMRLDFRPKNKIWWGRIGYSQVADKADIIAPWRGFPTGGFTRAMAQYNWYANTKTWMVRGVFSLDRAGIVSGLKISLRYAVQDFDDKKSGVQADSRVVHLDLLEKVKSVPGLYLKFRTGVAQADENIRDINGDIKPDSSYKEFRFEVNYLF